MSVTGWLILLGMFGSISLGLLVVVYNVVGQLTLTNKQLLIFLVGKEPKPESALRALITSQKPPQGKLKGIADGKKKNKKPENKNYIMEVGVH